MNAKNLSYIVGSVISSLLYIERMSLQRCWFEKKAGGARSSAQEPELIFAELPFCKLEQALKAIFSCRTQSSPNNSIRRHSRYTSESQGKKIFEKNARKGCWAKYSGTQFIKTFAYPQ